MLEPFDDITRDDFLSSSWKTIVANCGDKNCFAYHSRFLDAARKAEEEGDANWSRIYGSLWYVTSLKLNLDTPDEPLKPLFLSRDGRTAIVEDFDDSHLQFFSDVLADVDDAALQARIADLLWLRRGDYRYGEIAVAAYLKSSEALENFQHWGSPADSIERSRQIAMRLGKNTKSYQQVLRHIEALLAQCNGADPYLLSYRLMKMLIEREEGDPAKYAPLTEKLALSAEAKKDWEKARQYWEIQAEWHKLSHDHEQTTRSKVKAAECYVQYAEEYVRCQPPQYSSAARWIQRAVVAMRRISGAAERAAELHVMLLDYQQRSVHEFNSDYTSIDITKLANTAVEQVKDKRLADAMFALAVIHSISDKAELRQRAIVFREDSGIFDLCELQYPNEMGRNTAPHPQGEENGLIALMHYLAVREHSLIVQGIVEPARQQIRRQHPIRLADFALFVQDSPFVRLGHETIIMRGLYAGMQGDMLTAIHFLIPQIEDSIRYVLQQVGVIAAKLDDRGTQEEYNLNKILRETKYTEPLAKTFGEDLLFDLRGLLIEPYGSNLRNDMAHGLIGHDTFYSTSCYYLWWLALRLYAWPALVHSEADVSSEDTTSEAESKADNS